MMKKVSLLLLIGIVTMTFNCKKKASDPEPEPEPTPAPVVTPVVSVKVNGVEKKCNNSCYFSQKVLDMRTLTLDINSSTEQLIFTWDEGAPKAGVYNLTKYGEPTVRYGKGSSIYVSAVTGTVNISSADTNANGAVSKLACTFSFKTDTMNGEFFNMTEGSINLK